MKTFFIQQPKKISKFVLRKVSRKENKIFINVNLEKIKFKTKINIAKKIMKILELEKSRQIVLEPKIKEDKQFVNLLYGYNINICNPKWLFKHLTNDIIDKVLKNKKREESEIWICVNEVDTWLEKYIYNLAKDFKNINIITNHIGKFKKIESKLYNEEGILINLSNNKRKSLLKAKLILNVDFPKELLNQFAIFDDAVIINLDGDIKIRKKRFKGRLLNNYEIEIDKQDEVLEFIQKNHLESFDVRDICQAIERVPVGILTI